LSIKGASTQGNVVEVKGLAPGTTAEDVAAIFKQCGAVVDQKLVESGKNVRVRIHFKTPGAAKAAVTKFHGQPADGKVLEVSIVGSSTAGQTLASRFGKDGLGLVRQEGSVDVLMETDGAPTSYATFLHRSHAKLLTFTIGS
jgi:RNA recognition motif-containing protein